MSADRQPTVELSVSPPLGTWKLQYLVEEEMQGGGAATVLTGIAAFVVVVSSLVGLSVFLYRESMRDINLATQRVQFVNQVSHELRTPLTNIRLYAELLEQKLEDSEDEHAREHVGVIVAECHRLSRLIGNVLTFGRHRRGKLKLHPTQGDIGQTIATVLEQFHPSLASRGIVVTVSNAVVENVFYDADAVEQILANLLSNVEKYAAKGKRVSIGVSEENGWCVVRVSDVGPGIPVSKHEAVFEPFARLCDSLTEGVSGSGIGLTISRELARLHGGELRSVPTDQGACFELTLPLVGRQSREV